MCWALAHITSRTDIPSETGYLQLTDPVTDLLMKPNLILDKHRQAWNIKEENGSTWAVHKELSIRIPLEFAAALRLPQDDLEVFVNFETPHQRLQRFSLIQSVGTLKAVLADGEYRGVVDQHDDDGYTLLYQILREEKDKSLEIAEVLIEAGADPYRQQTFPAAELYASPFSRALKRGMGKAFALLIRSSRIGPKSALQLYRAAVSPEAVGSKHGQRLQGMLEVLKRYLVEQQVPLPDPPKQAGRKPQI